MNEWNGKSSENGNEKNNFTAEKWLKQFPRIFIARQHNEVVWMEGSCELKNNFGHFVDEKLKF